jgi:adenylate cyclase
VVVTIDRTSKPGVLFVLRAGLLFFVQCHGPVATPQHVTAARAWADSLFRTMENADFPDPASALVDLDRMLAIYRAEGDRCRQVRVGSWRAGCFNSMGRLDSAMAVAQHAISLFDRGCDSIAYMSVQVNLTNTLLSMGEYARVLEITEKALAAWNTRWPYSVARNGLFTNRAIALAYLGDLTASLNAFKDGLSNARQEGKVMDELFAYANLGALFGMMSEQGTLDHYLDSAAYYSRKALAILKALDDRPGMMDQYSNMAAMSMDRRRYGEALLYLDSAEWIAVPLRRLEMRATIAKTRAQSYHALGEGDSAYFHMELQLALKDSLLDAEKVRAIADVQEKYESEKKARTISELQVEKLAADLRQASLRRTRNIYLFSGVLILLGAGGLWNRLRFVHRSRALIRKEKEISEGLLLNILPGPVAEELKVKGEAEAQLFDQVTVLFTDFKGFTAVSEQLSPKELVRDIHECFSAFDHIITKHGVEKIKTIGDAYMAAGGLPTPNGTHAFDVVRAALEIRDLMEQGKATRIQQGRPYFEVRIGIHTGPVVAGIVGVKKFAYDIWGDTVNIASRMESSGEVGMVNISGATCTLLQQDPAVAAFLRFTSRGMLPAKGKGDMAMFFVERTSSSPLAIDQPVTM